MRRVLFYIKKFLFFVILWGCVFQSILLLTSETPNETVKEIPSETLKGCNKSIKVSPKNCKGESMKEEEIKKQVEILRKDTEHIINANSSVCTLIRDVPIKNEKGETVSYERIKIENVVVRFSISQGLDDNETLAGTNENIRQFILTAKYDADIKRGDVLKDEKDCYFKVKGITDNSFWKNRKEYCFRKSGWVVWAVT